MTAIDPSDDQLAYARARPRVKPAEFRVGSAEKLPFAENSFDVAVMALVISFLSDPSGNGNGARGTSGRMRCDLYVGHSGGGVPVDPIYVKLESMGMTSMRPLNTEISRREVMQELWRKIGLESVDTRVIRIPVEYSDFDDFWVSNTVPIGPQGKLIDGMSANEKEQLRSRLRDRLPIAADGRVTYVSFANAVSGRVPG